MSLSNIKDNWLPTLIVTGGVLWLFLFAFNNGLIPGRLKAGQVWTTTYGDSKNPFGSSLRVETNIVIETKGYYVKFRHIEKAWFSQDYITNTSSSTLSYFLIGPTKQLK